MHRCTASIVVVTSDRPIDLRRCLGVLRSHLRDFAHGGVEVITVHSPTDHEALAMVRTEFAEVRAIVANERHISRQRNLGARHARGDVVIYLDDDAWPHDGWLHELLTAFADPRVVAASGPVFRGDGSLQNERLAATAIGRLSPMREHDVLARGSSPSFSGCNLAVRRSALFACGGFDQNLPYQPDDMDVCRRLFAHANHDPLAMRYRPRASVTHESSPGPYRRTLQDRAWYVVARDNVYFACRHAGLVRGVLGSLVLQAPKLVRFCKWMLTGKLTPIAFCRCVGKHVAGVVAGIVKGATHDAALPLVALPRETNEPIGVRSIVEENPSCRTPQPV